MPPHATRVEGLPRLLFVRHGATSANLAKLRCGGDLDLPLADVGVQQAQAVAARVAAQWPTVGLVVTSDLRRTRDTAACIAAALGGVEVRVMRGFAERHLGLWNLQPIAETQKFLVERQTPPGGGESDAAFTDRIVGAARELLPLMHRRPLLVGSKGVARVLAELAGLDGRLELDNGVLCSFDLEACLQTEAEGETT